MEPAPAPPSRTLLGIVLALVLALGLVACVAGVGLFLWARQDGLNPIRAIQLRITLAQREDDLNTPAGNSEEFQRFEVAGGDSAYAIASKLLAQGLITDADLFVDYVQYHRLDSQLEAGTFYLRNRQTIPEIARALTDASAATVPFRTLAGWRIEEIAEVIDSNPLLDFSGANFLAVVGRGAQIPADFKSHNGIPDQMSNGQPPSLEGFLYPGTYQLRPGITPEELRDEMLAAFSAAVGDEFYAQAEQQGLTMYEVVTLASIVQREAVEPSEAPRIAAVYLNRLRLPMRLDADPTVQYAIGNSRNPDDWWPPLTQADYYATAGLQNQSYSTYLNEGLPPGPINSPTLGSIRAVLEAPQTDEYYFRLGCDDRTHVFFGLDQQAEHAAFTCP